MLGDFLRRKAHTEGMAVTYAEATDVMELALAVVELMQHSEIDTSDKSLATEARMKRALRGIFNHLNRATYCNPHMECVNN